MPSRRRLSIALFPLIPDARQDDHADFRARVKQEFETLHPDIDLRVELSFLDHNTLDPDYLYNAFTGDNPLDGVETDSMNLSFLTSKGLALPVDQVDETLYPQAIEAFRIDGQLYGIPSGMCSSFLYSRNENILQAKNITQLLTILAEEGSLPKILGNFLGVPVLPVMYSLFYVGVYGKDAVHHSLSLPLDQKVMDVMRETLQDCLRHMFKDAPQPLSEYSTLDPYWSVHDYVSGKGHSYIGFSENLFHLLKYGSEQPIHFIPALFGDDHPVVFTDGFITNTQNCTDQRQADVAAFARYYSSHETVMWRTFSDDAPGNPPRYLLSAYRDFYDLPRVSADPHFQRFRKVLDQGVGFLNQGYLERREEVNRLLCEALQELVPV
jgi:thiamine pyridinylase